MYCKKLFCTILAAAAALSVAAGELTFKFSCNKTEPVFKVGEKIILTGEVFDDGKPAVEQKVSVYLNNDNKVVKYIKKVNAGKPFSFEFTPTVPGWVSMRIYVLDAKGKHMTKKIKRHGRVITESCYGGYGVMVEPEKLAVAKAEPADFDEFWNKVKADLAAVPVKELEKKSVPNAKADIFNVKISCIEEKPVSGYLCMPKNAKPKSLPAMLFFHGAGVGSSYANIGAALRGYIYFDVNAHGIENGLPRKHYNDLRANYYLPAGKPGYPHWGKDNRDTFYFKGMFARVLRALEYVKTLPQWDGKHLIVCGGSQGGAQVLVAAGLDKDVSLAKCEVPAMCDHSGCLAGHMSGWPKLYKATKDGKPDNQAVADCAGYFDGVHFAKRIKCPIYFSTGGIDFTCPPSSVYKAYNNIPAGTKKSLDYTPTGNHGGSKTKNFDQIAQKHIKE